MTMNVATEDRARPRGAGPRASGDQTTFAIVDDHPLMRLGVSEALSAVPDLVLVAEGACAAEAVQIAVDLGPDLMLLDLNLPGSGLEALLQIRDRAPAVRCVILTIEDRPERALECLDAGAVGYVLKGVATGELTCAVRSVLRGDTFVSPQFATRMVEAARLGRAGASDARMLSEREEQVMEALERGMTNKQIALALNLSERTVKHYLSCVMQRFGVNNRVATVVEYRKARDAAAGVGRG